MSKLGFGICNAIGNTPIVYIKGNPNYYAKLEGFNPFGSIKDRAAFFVMKESYKQNIISKTTEIIESSSGNFAIALAAVCQLYGNKFTCVVDPSLTPLNHQIIQCYGADLIFADVADDNGSYLKNRLEKVNQLLSNNKELYWINQYNNPLMRRAYTETICAELCNSFEFIDYLFVPVSTCGVIAGLSIGIKDKYPKTKIIAVDIKGSRIFCENPSGKRYIPGMGASIVPGNLQYSIIDDIVHVHEKDVIRHCTELLSQSILVGGSSGAVSAAIEKYFCYKKSECVIVAIFPDRGERYLSNIYDARWNDCFA